MENEIIKIEESAKDWAIVGSFNDYDFGQLVEFFSNADNFLPAINFAKERVRNLVADPTTSEGQIARKSLAKKIGQIDKAIADKGMEVARVLKAKPKEVDAVRKRIKDSLQAYKDEVLAPIKEIENRQKEIAEIDNLPAQGIGCDSEGIKILLERLDGMAKDAKYWKESAALAEDSVREARRQLNDMLARAEKDEADRRELEELRKHKEEMERANREKAEAELKKAQEEAAKAKADAERLANEKEDAIRAKEVAESNASLAERKAQDAMDRLPEDERRLVESPAIEPLFPEAEKERKRTINNEILEKLVKFTEGDVLMAKSIITAIAKGNIPHVRIMY